MKDFLIGFGISVPVFGIAMIFAFIFYDGEDSGGGSSGSQALPKYCISAGCTNRPSVWHGGESGYCKEHAQQIMEQQKQIDKLKTQGY